MVGPVGDVFDVEGATGPNGHYVGDLLSDAQIAIAALGEEGHMGRTKIPASVIEWASGESVLEGEHVQGEDSMGHAMKGSIGMFLPQASNVIVANCQIVDVANRTPNEGAPGAAYGIALSGRKE